MSLTTGSTGRHAIPAKEQLSNAVIALAGNPNVGKSTIFNALTGMHQHTGNWPGKTVGIAQGWYIYNQKSYTIVDLPGTYSLMAHSAEEELARDFICFGEADAVIVVCDATCLVRNLNLVLQILEVTPNVVVCINLIDEAAHKGIHINCSVLSKALGVPVVATVARDGRGLNNLKKAVADQSSQLHDFRPFQPTYRPAIEQAIGQIETVIRRFPQSLNPRWLALRWLEGDTTLQNAIQSHLKLTYEACQSINKSAHHAHAEITDSLGDLPLRDAIVADLYHNTEAISQQCIHHATNHPHEKQLHIDRLLTGRLIGIPLMILLLLCVLWLTICGANYPSALLSSLLFSFEAPLANALSIALPNAAVDLLVDGVYRVLAWVISVMLPPMAIFFPLFTLLEDVGYLPRVAFNLDAAFKKCHACGKQALTMCMGFGCNAAGVIGCRIIDSPRERMLAILTNSFVPCNGRFPLLISIISMFLMSRSNGIIASFYSAAFLTGMILLGIGMTFLCSHLLSKTLLKGMSSAFVLELPSYRRPQVGQIVIRSVFDRTLFVLGRAATVAAPAGLLIYLMANCTIGGSTLLTHCAGFLDPFARAIGLDGVILMAFILGFPANEIVIPIVMMAYSATGTLTDFSSLEGLRSLLINHGWTWLTAVCTMLFSLLHWPCSTTLISIKKETGSWYWSAVAFCLPTGCGILLCFILTTLTRCLGLI